MTDAEAFLTGTQGELEKAQQAHNYLLALGDFTVRFATVPRAPRYPDGHRETDVEHSFHLALSATELAANYFPQLNTGLVSLFSNVHDMPEVYTGDVWTFDISDEDRAKKEAAEKEATARLMNELPPFTADLLRRYEEQVEREARFVRYVDKSLPAIINIMAGEANTFTEDYGIQNVDELNRKRAERTARLHAMFPEFPFMHLVRDLISSTARKHMFPE